MVNINREIEDLDKIDDKNSFTDRQKKEIEKSLYNEEKQNTNPIQKTLSKYL